MDACRHALLTGQGVVLDRSVYSDSVFAVANRKDGNISEEGFAFYQMLRAHTLAPLPPPHVVLYLRASPDTCAERVAARSRDCEAGIPLAYLQRLHSEYDEFAQEMTERDDVHVSIVDWNKFGSTQDCVNAVAEAQCREWSPELRSHLAAL